MVYEIAKNCNHSDYPKLENCSFGAVTLIKNSDIDNYKCLGYGDRHGFFSQPGGGTGKNVIIFVVDMNSFTKTDNRNKYILILGKDPTQG